MNDWVEASATTGDTWDGQGAIEGQYISKKTEIGKNKSNLYALKTSTGTTGVWGGAVLDTKFEEIPIGSVVRVEFLGMAESRNGNQYKDYKVLYKAAPFAEAGASPAQGQQNAVASGPAEAAKHGYTPHYDSLDEGPPIEGREEQPDERAF